MYDAHSESKGQWCTAAMGVVIDAHIHNEIK